MLYSNLIIALRNLRKNKVYAAINIVGLAVGLTIYLFGNLLIKYETTHDAFFANSDRIYTLGSVFAPELNMAFSKMNSTYTAMTPIIEAELRDVEAVARTLARDYFLTADDRSFNEILFFSDPALLNIFDFTYLHGDNQALTNPSGMLITESQAIKYFGSTDVLGDVITIDNQHSFQITAVIEDIAKNSHFVTDKASIFVPISALIGVEDTTEIENWDFIAPTLKTYVLLADGLDGPWLERQLNGLFDQWLPIEPRKNITGFYVLPIADSNLALWDSFGIPIVAAVSVLCVLVLFLACLNYTNLATAQCLGRSREVGMRKSMGATQGQLIGQFLVESCLVALAAMLLSIAALEAIVPVFNNLANKALALNYSTTLLWMLSVTLAVGLISGFYPAWLITNTSAISALQEQAKKGRSGSRVRSIMVGVQFAISSFMLALVLVVYIQNMKVEQASHLFPKSEIYVLSRLDRDDIRDNLDTLKYQLESLAGVEAVSFSSQVPFEGQNNFVEISATPEDDAGKFRANRMQASPDFFSSYDIPLLDGRYLSDAIAMDIAGSSTAAGLNVVVNELALELLGIPIEDAVGERFYSLRNEDAQRELVIVGVVPTQNIIGLASPERPWVFSYNKQRMNNASIRISGDIFTTIEEIEEVWEDVIPGYEIQGRFLDEVFDESFDILTTVNKVLSGIAAIALVIAMTGLFGLAAFMATQRTKEIGIRKVLGASSHQVARLLIWQFSKPVLWALAVALPLAFVATKVYLRAFSERVESPVLLIAVAGLLAVMLCLITVAGQAYSVARSNPIKALRHE